MATAHTWFFNHRLLGRTSSLLIAFALSPTVRALGQSATITAAADANLTGASINTYSPASYGLVLNIFQNTLPIMDYNLAAIPLNATVTSAQFDFRETSYTDTSSSVGLLAYSRTGPIVVSDSTAAATTVGSYDPVSLGLGSHAAALNASGDSLLQSLLGTNKHLGLRLSGNDNTQVGSLEQPSFVPVPSITASYTLPNNPMLIPRLEANITGSTLNHYSLASYGLVVNTFDGTQPVLDYTLSGLPTSVPIVSATFSFYETGRANATGNVSLYAYARSGNITSADATASAALVGSYGSVALGSGDHSLTLNAAGVDLLQSLRGSSNDVGLRLTSASDDTNTTLASLDQYPAWSVPALTLTLATPGDANDDGTVDFNDFLILSQHFGQPGDWSDANFDGSSTVDFNDFLILSQHFGQSISGSSSTMTSGERQAIESFASESAPEPASLSILALAAFPLVRRRRSRRTTQSSRVPADCIRSNGVMECQ